MKKFMLCIALYLACCSLDAQNLFRMPAYFNTGAELIDETFREVFVIVRQNYALQDASGQRFGRGGEPYFNLVDFIGVKTEEGILLFDDVTTPWLYDKEFQSYKDKYEPYMNLSSVLDISGTKILLDSLSIDENNFQSNNSWYCLKDSLFTIGVLVSHADTISSNGWLIWMSLKSDKVEKPVLHISKKEINKDKKGLVEDVIAPDLSGIVLGGLFVTPQSNIPGTLSFVVEAIMVRKDKTNWAVVPLHKINAPNDSHELTPLYNNEK